MSNLQTFIASYVVDDSTGCWNWAGSLNLKGYGLFRRDRHQLAHRWSYAHHKGAIPKGLCVCHTCDNRKCVNPDHLWVGSQSDNVADMIAKGRQNTYRGPHPWVARFGDANPSRTHIHRMPRGERVNTCKLTEDAVKDIREKHKHGRSQLSLAKEYGVSQPNIGHIVLRKSWKHI